VQGIHCTVHYLERGRCAGDTCTAHYLESGRCAGDICTVHYLESGRCAGETCTGTLSRKWKMCRRDKYRYII
jgi:hypothetical protein